MDDEDVTRDELPPFAEVCDQVERVLRDAADWLHSGWREAVLTPDEAARRHAALRLIGEAQDALDEAVA